MIHRIILAGGSSKRADRAFLAAVFMREPITRQKTSVGFPIPVSVKRRAPCFLRSHLNSCVPFPRTSFAFSSSFCQPVLHRQGFGTMDALTPLPAGLPACRWPHRFGLRRFAPTLGLSPASAPLFTRCATSGHVSAIHSGEVSWVHPALLPNRAIRQNLGGVRHGLAPSPRDGGGLHHATQSGHACPRPYPPVQPFGLQLSSLPHGPPHPPLRERTATRLPRP